MKVEIGAKTAARTIKHLLRALEIAEAQLKRQDREISRLQFDNEHQAREIRHLEASLDETRTRSEDLMRQLDVLAAEA